MALKDYPEWVLAHKKPGEEIRLIKGKYYVYKCSSFYDKETKKHKKVTGEYLGRITETDGFLPAIRRMIKLKDAQTGEQTIQKVDVKKYPIDTINFDGVRNLEYGFYCFYLERIMPKYVPYLKYFFPYEWQTLLAMSYCRLMFQSPLNRMQSDFKKSYMSRVLPEAHLSEKYLTGFIRDLGQKRGLIIAFFQEIGKGCENVIFDGTDIISASRLMSINKVTKTKRGTYDEALNVMCAYSTDTNMPLGYVMTGGNIKDISEFEDCLDELSISKDDTVVLLEEGATITLDKGFVSEKNLSIMESRKIDYIVSLKRNDHHIDYSCTKNPEMSEYDGYFEYEGERIWYKELGKWDDEHPDRLLYLYYNKKRADIEAQDFQKYNSSLKKDDYVTKYKESYFRFGTIVLACPDKKFDPQICIAQNRYFNYKAREHVEDSISAIKTVVGADVTRMQDEVALEGWMFTNYLALCWYYVMRGMIMDKKLISKFSPKAIFQMFIGVRVIGIGKQWKLTHILKRDSVALRKIGIIPSTNYVYPGSTVPDDEEDDDN